MIAIDVDKAVAVVVHHAVAVVGRAVYDAIARVVDEVIGRQIDHVRALATNNGYINELASIDSQEPGSTCVLDA